ncbi:MAG: hypothetical protein EOO96_05335 [Pedobacter sp.]|nr:MAG: hypothetical protein EOO96_05335 [Pedobacter sp.]
MGFGFNLFFIFIVLPLSTILLIGWLLTKKNFFAVSIVTIWLGVLGIIILAQITTWLNSPISLTKEDYYGDYVINRKYFKGSQADWQYENFRFEIKENDSIYFYQTNRAKIIKTYKGKIDIIKERNYERLIIEMEEPSHHLLVDNPIIGRKPWDFQLIFYSTKFHNVFFTKDKWKPIKNKKRAKIMLRP